MEWETLQAKVQGLNLNKLLNEQFLKDLNAEFEDKEIDAINLQIALRDKKVKSLDDDFTDMDIITLSNRDIEDTLLDTIIVDVNHVENFNKIKVVLNKL